MPNVMPHPTAGSDFIGVGVAAFIVNDIGEVLLQLRKHDPERGRWSLPGGEVKFLESTRDAVVREVREELGVTIRISRLLGIVDHMIPDAKQHWVSVVFLAHLAGQTPSNAEPENTEAIGWFSLDAPPAGLALPVSEAIRLYRDEIPSAVEPREGGKEFFADRMRLSMADKLRLLDDLIDGATIELGCAAGDVIGEAQRRLGEYRCVGIDNDVDLLRRAIHNYPLVYFQKHDLTFWQPVDLYGSFTNVIMSSVLHEVPAESVGRVLGLAAQLLRQGGRLVFRDGVKPEMRSLVVLRPKTEYGKAKLRKFLAEYRNRPIRHTRASEAGDNAIRVSLYDAHDILCKYWYEGELWKYDLDESFGTMSLADYLGAIREAGFVIAKSTTYAAEFQISRWQRDFEIIGADFPSSHALIIAVKKGDDAV